jgi:hypothetical protein
LLLFLGRVGWVQPLVSAFVRFSVFLYYFEQLLEGLRFDSVEHILAVAYSQAPTMASILLLSDTPGARAVNLTTLFIYFCSDSLSP